MPIPGKIPFIPIRGASTDSSKFQRDDPTMEDRGDNPNILRYISSVQYDSTPILFYFILGWLPAFQFRTSESSFIKNR